MNRKALVLVSVCLALVLGGLISAGTAPARDSVTRDQLRSFLETYVRLSNARDFEGLKNLYVPQPYVEQKGEVIEGDFGPNLAENMASWDEHQVEFGLLDILSISSRSEEVVVEFEMEGTGKVWVFPVSRTFTKKLVLVPGEETGWKIREDITLE
jgi:hypothetical protein